MSAKEASATDAVKSVLEQSVFAAVSLLLPLLASVLARSAPDPRIVYAVCGAGVPLLLLVLFAGRRRLGVLVKGASFLGILLMGVVALTTASAELDARQAREAARAPAAAMSPTPQRAPVPVPQSEPLPARERRVGDEGFARFDESHAQGTGATLQPGRAPLAPSRDLQLDRLPKKAPAKPVDFAVFRDGESARQPEKDQKGATR